jgi:hypothetical protein
MILFTKYFRSKRWWLHMTAGQNAEPQEMGERPPGDAEISPEQRRARANEAKQLLENAHFRDAFAAVHEYLEAQAHSCDPDNKDKAQRIIIAKQLLQAVRREVIRKVDDGYMAEVQLAEIERKRGLLRFRR